MIQEGRLRQNNWWGNRKTKYTFLSCKLKIKMNLEGKSKLNSYASTHACSVAQSCPTLCDSMDCSPPGSSVHGTVQARTQE